RLVWLDLGHLRNGLEAPTPARLDANMDRYGISEPECYLMLGFAYVRQQNLPRAREQFRHALALAPEFYHAGVNLGDVERLAGNREQAICLYREVLGKAPLDLQAHKGLTDAYRALGKRHETDQAMEQWQRALDAYLETEA